MSSYFDYYCSNLENTKAICNTMCPEDEIILREKEGMVHVLEVWGAEHKLVKSYSRSAADANMAVPKLLRPFSVLNNTVKYLLLEVIYRSDVPSPVLYDYITDRLRAVRQDMTIQMLPPYECVRLLDPMVRFHVYYGYKLNNLPLKDYDPVINKKMLLECLKWCLSCWDILAKGQNIDKVEELSDLISNIKLDKDNCDLSCDRILMETLYIMCNLDYIPPLIRYQTLPNSLKKNPTLNSAYKVALANLRQNYIQVGKCMDTLCPLSYCAFYMHLPELQRQALLVMSHAYNNKQLTVPCHKLRQWLRISSLNEVIQICKHYGLEVVGEDSVRLSKMDFNSNKPVHRLELCKHNNKLDLSVKNIFLYKTSI